MRCKPHTHSPCVGLLIALAALLIWTQGASAAVIKGNQVSFNWADAAGPVAGYNVFVTRNGSTPTAPDVSVSQSTTTLTASTGDTIAVQVAAFDAGGNQGPISPPSEVVLFEEDAPPPPPGQVIVEVNGDYSFSEALAAAQPGEQVVAQVSGSTKLFLDAGLPEGHDPNADWGLDQLVVGSPGEPTTVRLVDALALAEDGAPLADLPTVTLFGLGNGAPCARDGGPGLLVAAGSVLVLGGMDLVAFDGDTCVHVNELFPETSDPKPIAWGDGQIALHGDLENDGVIDPEDNCLIAPNADQCDGDQDGFGNACDFDVDGDGVTSLVDASMVMAAAKAVSEDPVYDLDCDGGVALKDLSVLMQNMSSAPGPSGLACAGDGSCQAP
jgi:hypothetical protein